jgi:hypothetical protein
LVTTVLQAYLDNADKTQSGGTLGVCVFYRYRIEFIKGIEIQTRVEAGSNTSTVTLRVVGGDEKGSLKSETVKYGLKSHGTRTRERLRWQGPAAHTKDRPDLSSERAPHKNKTVTVTQVIKIGRKPQMGALFQDRLAG